MKALPPPPPQLTLAIYQDRALMVLDPEARNEAVRALAEILRVAADVAAGPAKLTEAGNEAP